MRFGESCGGKAAPLQIERGTLRKTCLAACRYFATERWDFSERVSTTTSPERFELLIPLSGRGRIEWNAQSTAYGPADVWILLLRALGAYQLSARIADKIAAASTFVPDLQKFSTREISPIKAPNRTPCPSRAWYIHSDT